MLSNSKKKVSYKSSNTFIMMKRLPFRDLLRGSSSDGLISTDGLIWVTNNKMMETIESIREENSRKCTIDPETLLMIIWNQQKCPSKHHH